jgi:hypothetical protein
LSIGLAPLCAFAIDLLPEAQHLSGQRVGFALAAIALLILGMRSWF